jgi:hypothetical protein
MKCVGRITAGNASKQLSDGRILALEFRNALQAECAPTFDSVIRRFRCFPPPIINFHLLFYRKVGQANEPLEPKRIEAVIANEQIAQNGEAAPNWKLPVINLLRNVRACFHKSDRSVGLADHDAYRTLQASSLNDIGAEPAPHLRRRHCRATLPAQNRVGHRPRIPHRPSSNIDRVQEVR